jgi:hypothetical protein
MGPYEIEERKAIDGHLKALLEAPNAGAALNALRQLFVGELDFQHRSASIALEGEELPQSATLVASRDGVQVAAVRLPAHGRVLVRSVREALKQIRAQVSGDVLLAAGSGRRRLAVAGAERSMPRS